MTDEPPGEIRLSESSGLLNSALKNEYRHKYGFNILFAGLDKAPKVSWEKWQTTAQTDDDVAYYFRDLGPQNVTCWGFICGYGGLVAFDFDWAWMYRLWRTKFGERAETLTVQTPNGGYRPHFITDTPVTDDRFKRTLHAEIKGPGRFVAFEGKAQREDGSIGEYRVAVDKPIRSDDAILADTLAFLQEMEERYHFLRWSCLRPHFSRKVLGKPSHDLRLILSDITAYEAFAQDVIRYFFHDFPDLDQVVTDY